MKSVVETFDIRTLQKYYNGFFIDRPAGNNAFSHGRRENKQIYVPPIIKGGIRDLAVGEKIVFSEIGEGGVEINTKGLKSFVYLQHHGKDVFIFDNHNHAFFFWAYALKLGPIGLGSTLVHVDQHRDTRKPARYFTFSDPKAIDLKAAFEYTNFELNVGNFIKPALAANIFTKLEVIDSRSAFTQSFDDGIVLDIDLDIFCDDMAYIEEDYKIEKIKQYLQSASLVTMATSPFFMEQSRAINLAKLLLK